MKKSALLFFISVFLFLFLAQTTRAQTSPIANADLNLKLRGWSPVTNPPLGNGLIDVSGPTDPTTPPTLNDLIRGNSQPTFSSFYQVYGWDWSTNQRGDLIQANYKDNWGVTLAGLSTNPGDVIQVPDSGYGIGGGYQVIVLYADSDSITIHYTLSDTVSDGYTIQLQNFAVNPDVLAAYQSANANGRTQLPALASFAELGKATGKEALVSIRDSGSFMDPRSRKDWWQGTRAAGAQKPPLLKLVTTGSVVRAGSGSLPVQSYPNESEVPCNNLVYGDTKAGSSTYRKANGTTQPEMRTDAGLNSNGLVQGTHCGQIRSQPITLNEVAPFDVNEGPSCKTVTWVGTLGLNSDNSDNFRIPFAEEVADHWAGTLDAEHLKESDIDKLYSDAYPSFDFIQSIVQQIPILGQIVMQNELKKETAAIKQIGDRGGVMRKLLGQGQQDALKCSFIKYVQKKGGSSLYSGFKIEGTSLINIPCPPTVDNPNASQSDYVNWQKTWGSKWSKMGLVPNEKSVGQIKFMVCGDRQYLSTQAYPEVFKLGLSANELFKIYTAKDLRDSYYKANSDDNNLKIPLDKNRVLAYSAEDKGKGGNIQNLALIQSLQKETGRVLSNSKTFLNKLVLKIRQGLAFLGIENILAQGCDEPLEAGIELISENPLEYSAYIRKTACGEQQYPGTIGDIQIYIPGGTPHTENMWKGTNELRWDTTNPDTASFLPRVGSIDELLQLVLLFRADRIQFGPHEIRYKGGVAPPPPPGGPVCKITPACTAACPSCGKAQLMPSDTTVWNQGDPKNQITLGSSSPVNLSWYIPAWDGTLKNLPPGCRFVECHGPKCVTQASYQDPDTGRLGEIICTKVNDRTIDVFNSVPLLASAWNQSAGATSGQNPAGFLNVFKPKCDANDPSGICSQPATLTTNFTSCTTDENYVFDRNGTFNTNPAASYLTYDFRTTQANGVTVTQTSPAKGQKAKVLFYRLGGLCNANKWVSEKVFNP